jgi:hypothetical protein
VRARADEQGRLQLKQSPPPGRGLRGFLARHFSMFPSRRACLDEKGTFFWQQIDGQTTLGEIEARLREHYRLEQRQSMDAVVLFTKMLMRRGLIALQLPDQAQSNPPKT